MSQLVYHRLDVLPTDNTCMHLKQLATLGQLVEIQQQLLFSLCSLLDHCM